MPLVVDVDIRERMMLAGDLRRLFPALVADQTIHIGSFLDIPALLVTAPVNYHSAHDLIPSFLYQSWLLLSFDFIILLAATNGNYCFLGMGSINDKSHGRLSMACPECR
jgi:hypothetical protein